MHFVTSCCLDVLSKIVDGRTEMTTEVRGLQKLTKQICKLIYHMTLHSVDNVMS